MAPILTIIIPTVCSEERAATLLRAIESALASATQESIVLVVANGPRVSEGLFRQLQDMPRVQSLRLETGSSPNAVIEGRKLIATEFFGFLDDDDELLQGASELRLQQLQQDASVDIAVINGYREVGGTLNLMMPTLQGIASEPLRTLLDANWLASCAALFRTRTVGVEVFLDPQPLAEWTWLAYRLALLKMRFCPIEEPGYVIHDTPSSLSKTQRYVESYIGLFDRMLSENPPAWASRKIVQKRCNALHDLSYRALQRGDYRQAWRLHIQSLNAVSGLKYFFFGRKIFVGAVRSALSPPADGRP